jgi:putative hemolysin
MLTAAQARKFAKARRRARAPFRLLKSSFKLLRVKRFPISKFQTKVSVFQSTENFILKTVESPFELRQVLRLRHEIFYRELQNKETESQLDIDEMDAVCDHLIIIDRKSGEIVGTYRLISSSFSSRFYSEGEFAIKGLLSLPGNKLELGRACIHAEYRTGAIINLLWKGIAEYIRKTDTKYLFGCASVQTEDPALASRLLAYLRAKGLSSEEFGVEPVGQYRTTLPAATADDSTAKELPALVQSYILAGAKFYGEPAYDRDFQCFDFFMMLRIDEMSRLFRRRYRLDE